MKTTIIVTRKERGGGPRPNRHARSLAAERDIGEETIHLTADEKKPGHISTAEAEALGLSAIDARY